MEKATIKDLIARKMQRDNDKIKIFEVPVKSMGKSLVIKKPSDNLRLDMLDELGTDPGIKDTIMMYKKLIYFSCELLQNAELQEHLGVKDPLDTVDAIFDLDDIMDIGEKLIDAEDPSMREKIKNS